MDTFAGAIQQSISDHLGHREDIESLRPLMDAFSQAANLCTIQSRDGREIYATGMRPDLNIVNPVDWPDVEEHITLHPYVANNQVQNCAIEQVPNLELRVGSRVVRFADASRTKCCQFNRVTGRLGFYYIFENFIPAGELQPTVEVIVTVFYTLRPEVLAQRNLATLFDNSRDEFFDAATNPSRFSTSDLLGSVSFDLLSFLICCEEEDTDNEEEGNGVASDGESEEGHEDNEHAQGVEP